MTSKVGRGQNTGGMEEVPAVRAGGEKPSSREGREKGGGGVAGAIGGGAGDGGGARKAEGGVTGARGEVAGAREIEQGEAGMRGEAKGEGGAGGGAGRERGRGGVGVVAVGAEITVGGRGERSEAGKRVGGERRGEGTGGEANGGEEEGGARAARLKIRPNTFMTPERDKEANVAGAEGGVEVEEIRKKAEEMLGLPSSLSRTPQNLKLEAVLRTNAPPPHPSSELPDETSASTSSRKQDQQEHDCGRDQGSDNAAETRRQSVERLCTTHHLLDVSRENMRSENALVNRSALSQADRIRSQPGNVSTGPRPPDQNRGFMNSVQTAHSLRDPEGPSPSNTSESGLSQLAREDSPRTDPQNGSNEAGNFASNQTASAREARLGSNESNLPPPPMPPPPLGPVGRHADTRGWEQSRFEERWLTGRRTGPGATPVVGQPGAGTVLLCHSPGGQPASLAPSGSGADRDALHSFSAPCRNSSVQYLDIHGPRRPPPPPQPHAFDGNETEEDEADDFEDEEE